MFAIFPQLWMLHHECGFRLHGEGVFAVDAFSEDRTLDEAELSSEHTLVVVPGGAIVVGGC